MDRNTRPGSVTLLALGVLMIGGMNFLRFVEAIRQWEFLETLLSISPAYLALSGLVWSAAGLALGWGVWRGLEWARRAALPVALAYSAYYWIDRLVISSEGAGTNWPFSIGLNLILLIWLAWILRRKRVQAFFDNETDRFFGQRE
jgi:hypothetical protein